MNDQFPEGNALLPGYLQQVGARRHPGEQQRGRVAGMTPLADLSPSKIEQSNMFDRVA
jgi:hypothetical protein